MKNVIKSYADYKLHREIGKLIKSYSENRSDIRDVVERALEWESTKKILDLGCGYGWFEETLKGTFDLVYGIDCHGENEAAFVGVSSRVAQEVVFKSMYLPCSITMPPDSFDLIVSAYTLYFFPEIIPEVKRLLHPGGTFVVITHSEKMLEEGEKYFEFNNLKKVIQRFSAENGEEILKKTFREVIAIDYYNSLVFKKGAGDDLARYIDFKREFIAKDVDPDVVRKKMLDELQIKGVVRFNKNDRIFIGKK